MKQMITAMVFSEGIFLLIAVIIFSFYYKERCQRYSISVINVLHYRRNHSLRPTFASAAIPSNV